MLHTILASERITYDIRLSVMSLSLWNQILEFGLGLESRVHEDFDLDLMFLILALRLQSLTPSLSVD